MAGNPWAWQEGHNPYRATPFQVLDLDPDTFGSAAVHAHIRRLLRAARTPERHPVVGERPAVADINEAAEQLRDPRGRLLAELRTHRPEHGQGPSRFAEEVAELEPPEVPAAPITVHAEILARIAPPPAPRSFGRMWPDAE